MRSAVAWCLLTLIAVGCSLASSSAIRDVRELAGIWQGRMSGPLGNGEATMTVEEDGAYTGTIFLGTGPREFHGAIVVIDPTRVRFQGTDGNGRVRRQDRDGRTILRFMLDGSGTGATYTRDR